MAKYKLNESEDVGTITLDEGRGDLELTRSLPQLGVDVEKGDGGYLDELEKLKSQMQSEDTIAAGDGVLDFDAVDGGFDLGPLQTARRLVQDRRYEEALAALEPMLGDPTGQPEATYLAAFCLFHLDKHEQALATLLPLVEVPLDETVARPLGQLRQRIRAKMLAAVLIENVLLVKTGNLDRAVTRLQRLTRLDPTAGLYHYMLAGNLMMADRLDEAMGAAETGLARVERGDNQQLQGLKVQIGRRLVETRMEPARVSYRKGSYAKARSVLERLDERTREHELCKAFYANLQALGGGRLRRGKSPVDVEPSGPFKIVDALHFFLVREEIGEAKKLMAGEHFDLADPVLDNALSLAPHFPYAHFLRGVCLYEKTGKSFTSSRPPTPDEVVWDLEQALRHARLGAGDPEIEGAPGLVKAIEGGIETMREVERELRAHMEEAQKVNGLVEKLKSVMELVGDGISSPDHFRRVHGAMGELQVALEILQSSGEITRPDGLNALGQLEAVVDGHMKQLAVVKEKIDEAERIHGLWKEFEAIGEMPKQGASMSLVKRHLEKLRSSVRSTRRSVTEADGIESLDKLDETIDSNLEQIEAMESVKPLADEFQSIMSSAKGGLSSVDQAKRLKRDLESLRKRVDKKKRRTRKGPVKEQLEELASGVSGAIGQVQNAIDDANRVPPEVEELNELGRRFQSVMKSVEGGIHSRSQLEKFKTDLGGVAMGAMQLKKRMSSKAGEEAVDQLIGAIGNVFGQLQT